MSACAAALMVLTVTVAAGWAPLVRLDETVSVQAFASTYAHDGRTAFWTMVTDGAAPERMRDALLLAALVATVMRRLDLAVWLVGLSLLEGIVAPASKHLLDRPRPEWADPITVLASTSYPSGHATAAATSAVAIALVVRRRAVTAAMAVLAVSVAASRVLLGAHYPSDVVAGALLGTLLAMSTYALLRVPGWRPSGPGVTRPAPEREVAGAADS
ncbi:phosphatase PAP2 family protein [Alloalcanivorax gelatiniphagus]